jgi:hypothetical protein
MAEKLDPKEVVTTDDLAISNMYIQEASLNILERKGLLTRKEVLEEIKRIKQEKPQCHYS